MVKRGWNLTSQAGPGSDSLYITHLLVGSIADIPIFQAVSCLPQMIFMIFPASFNFV